MREPLSNGHSDNRGQALVFVVIAAGTLVCFLALAIDLGKFFTARIKMQNAADSSALSGSIWQARGLNVTAGLNMGIIACDLIAIGCVAGMAAAYAAAPATMGASLQLIDPLKKTKEIAEKSGRAISEMQDKILDSRFFEIASVTNSNILLLKNGATLPSIAVPIQELPEEKLYVRRGTVSDILLAIKGGLPRRTSVDSNGKTTSIGSFFDDKIGKAVSKSLSQVVELHPPIVRDRDRIIKDRHEEFCVAFAFKRTNTFLLEKVVGVKPNNAYAVAQAKIFKKGKENAFSVDTTDLFVPDYNAGLQKVTALDVIAKKIPGLDSILGENAEILLLH